jgi:hypothetical protein
MIDEEKWEEELEEYYKTCLIPPQLEGKHIYLWAKAFWLESRRRFVEQMKGEKDEHSKTL